MEENTQEAKQPEETGQDLSNDNVDDFDKIYDGFEQEKLSDTSPENKPEDAETEETEDSGDPNLAKKEESEEEPEEVPKEFHNHPAWKRIMKERDEARQKLETQGKDENEEYRSKMEEFERVTSSPEYIRASMVAQGYTQEAINNKLAEMGHKVPANPTDEIQSVYKRLGVNPDTLDENNRAVIEDVVKVTKAVLEDFREKELPEHLKPIEQNLGKITQKESADEYVQKMNSIIKEDGILDFDADIAPELSKYAKDNPEATQMDLFEEFKRVNHKLVIERLKTKGKKSERDEKRGDLRNIKNNVPVFEPGKFTPSGDVEKDVETLLDALNVS